MRRLLSTLLFLIGAMTALAALPSVRELALVLQPSRVEQITLAQDGRHLAYTVRDGAGLGIMLVNVDDPAKRSLIGPITFGENETPRFSYFAWADADCLVIGIRRQGSEDLYAIDRADQKIRKLVDAREFDADYDPSALTPDREDGRSSSITLPRNVKTLGFNPDKPGILMIETTGRAIPLGQEPVDVEPLVETEIFEVAIGTGKKTSVFSENFSGRVIYDRQFRPQLVHLQPRTSAVQSIELVSSTMWRSSISLERVMDKTTAATFAWTPDSFFGPRSIPLAFDRDPKILYFASNDGRDCYGLFSINLETKKRRTYVLSGEAIDMVSPSVTPGSGAGLVFDRFTQELAGVRYTDLEVNTRWLDKELGNLQAALEAKLPRRIVRILDWDQKRARLLVAASSSDDPGRYFIFDRKDDRLVQFARRAPWFDLDEVNVTESFTVAAKDGRQLTGYVTQPKESQLNPPPLLVYLHNAPWTRAMPGFNTEVQALARMGFIVLQVNFRGSAGFGLKHTLAMKERLDEIPLEDIRQAIDDLAKRRSFDRKRVVLFGNGFGGYLAMRAMELHPGEYRCAIALNAPVDLSDTLENRRMREGEAMRALAQVQRMENYIKQVNAPIDVENPRPRPKPPMPPRPQVDFMGEVRRSFFGDASSLKKISVLQNHSLLAKPLLIIQDEDDPYLRFENAVALRKKAAGKDLEVDVVKLEEAYRTGDAGARARVFNQILEFLNANIYNYDVKVGPVEVKK